MKAKAEEEAWITKSGGDFARMAPAEEWQIRQQLDVEGDSGQDMPASSGQGREDVPRRTGQISDIQVKSYPS